jgi:hypothetical protein
VTTTRTLRLSGILDQHARNVSAPGLILPRVKDYMLKTFGWDASRDPTVIHPSEMVKPEWCPRATYLRITSGKWPDDPGKFDFVRENIFAAGNDIHAKWQGRMIDAGLPLWGDWKCRTCGAVLDAGLKPDPHDRDACEAPFRGHDWAYDEVTLDAKRDLLIAGHADGAFDDTMVEVKSIGVGTIRMEAPDLLARHTIGKHTDLTGLWRGITRPLRSHVRQGDTYLHLANVLGLPYTQIVYLYEFKANQMVKEFTVKYDRDRSMLLVAKAQDIKYGVDYGISPACITPGKCKQCDAYPKTRRTVARTRPHPS